MGKRRKQDRAASGGKREKIRDVFVPRPFAGLADEPDWVALRELVPAATAPLILEPELAGKYADRTVTLATVLPMAAPAVVRADGQIMVGLQRHAQSGDVSRDLAAALLAALETEPGDTVSVPPLPGPGPRLQDVLADGALTVQVHDSFAFWVEPEAAANPAVQASLERADASIYPTTRMAAAPAAYWCRVGERAHVRWVLPGDEDRTLDTLARLSAAGDLPMGPQTRFAGMFRAHGLLVPVWDLPSGPEAAEWEQPLAEFAERLAAAASVTDPLDAAARRSRQGLLGRQLTLR
ncbi:hypothetical protein EDC02_7570 [Micromonospora sp. Llam0]|uniref:DUF5926 family protein n=1 Tax=Micromonospora sp. Llam0 TaxID=2485143 RepID=UPI000F495996|nr:DUF5926 family protein [Micromonospora sp. Llam0]ROO52631.1 hypothetical protein EDC02_7570 [Micromonospora sp. Llam0]